MRIAILTELFPPYLQGGSERRCYEIARRLAKRHDVHVYTMHIAGSQREELMEGIHVHRLGKTHPLKTRAYLPLAPFFYETIKRVSSERFDIIDSTAYISALAGFIAAKRTHTPCTLTVHDIYGPKWGFFLGSPVLGVVGRLIELIMLKLPFDGFVTGTSGSRRLIERYGPKEVSVIPYGVDSIFYKRYGVKRKKKILFVGRLVPLKRVPDLLDAFAVVSKKHPEVMLELVGDGPLKEELESLANELGIRDKVIFTGSLRSHEGVAKKMQESMVLVNPSVREGFGLVLVEAMCSGTPPVGYKLDAYADFADSSNSILVAKGDVSGLADAVSELLENRRYWASLSKKGIKTAEGMSWDDTIKKLERFYSGLI